MSNNGAQIQVFLLGQETAYAVHENAYLLPNEDGWLRVVVDESSYYWYSPHTVAEIRVIHYDD